MRPRQRTASGRARPVAAWPRSDSALIIFVKAPVPGQVKTRLCPPLTPDEAASLHGSFVLDMLERSRPPTGTRPHRGARGGWRWDRFVACSPSPEHAFFKVIEERYGVRLLAQRGEDLGARMARAVAEVFALGYRHVVLIGTDVPTLPATAFDEAFALLASHHVVLGPAADGGYYLLGLRQAAPELFMDIPWSTDRVLALTRRKAAALGLSAALLQARRDVDTPDDLRALIEEASAGLRAEAAAASSLSPRTAGVLRLLAHRLRCA